jgi:hypothetical protein
MKHANSLYTAADHLLSEPPKPPRSGWWKWALALILAVLFVYRSTRPEMKLSAEPPPAFFGYNRTRDLQQRDHERRMALAYWNVAVRRIQRDYSPGKPLPANPPPEFQVADAASTLETNVMAVRVHYWYRLREVWNQRDAWVVSYGWNSDWLARSLNSLPRYLPRSVTGVVQALVDFFNNVAQEISIH